MRISPNASKYRHSEVCHLIRLHIPSAITGQNHTQLSRRPAARNETTANGRTTTLRAAPINPGRVRIYYPEIIFTGKLRCPYLKVLFTPSWSGARLT